MPAAAAYWQTEEWMRMPRERRVSEQSRHLEELGLSLETFRGLDVLDVGCGPTGLVYFLDGPGRRVGLDPTASAFSQHCAYWGEPIELIEAPAESLPFEDDSFDAVIYVNVLDHAYQPEAIIEEMARVVRAGGLLLFHVDLDSPLHTLHKALKKECRAFHPHALSYAWVQEHVGQSFRVEQEHRDPEVFRATWAQMRYEAYWDGLLYRLTTA